MSFKIHDFVGQTMTHLAEELIEHRAVRIKFKYNPSRHGIETLAKKVEKDIRLRMKHPVKEIKFFQNNQPDWDFDCWTFTVSAPSNNMEAKHLLSLM
jgi:hypothetical protein